MDKQDFLLGEYERLRASDFPMCQEWRESFDRFRADLEEIMPSWIAGRYLAPRDKDRGFVPGNVEWHFPRVRATSPIKARIILKQAKPAKQKAPSRRLTTAEKKQIASEERDKRRRKLAEEFRRWETGRNSVPQ